MRPTNTRAHSPHNRSSAHTLRLAHIYSVVFAICALKLDRCNGASCMYSYALSGYRAQDRRGARVPRRGKNESATFLVSLHPTKASLDDETRAQHSSRCVYMNSRHFKNVLGGKKTALRVQKPRFLSAILRFSATELI